MVRESVVLQHGGMTQRARLVGFNHVADLDGDVEEALDFYGRIFEVKLRGRGPGMGLSMPGTSSSPSPRAGWNRPTITAT